MRWFRRRTVFAVVALCACGGGDPSKSISPPTLASITVALNATSLGVGQTTQATATLADATGNTVVVSDATVAWTSSSTAVATVSSSGLVTAVSIGTATITASLQGKSGQTTVSVVVLPSSLGILVQPAGAVTGSALATQPIVQIKDNVGAVIPTSTATVTAAVTTGSGTLVGTTTATAVGGVATFANLRVDGSGSHVLTFSIATPALSVASGSFSVAVGPISQLAITTQPPNVMNGASFAPQPVIEVRDVANQRIASAALAITATIASGTGVLSGTTTVNAASGVATYSNLAVAGSGVYTLKFTASSPALSVTSNNFSVSNITGLSRDGGSSAGGVLVQIQGAGFGAGDIVKFGANTATNVTLIDAFTLQAKVPAGTPGIVDVTVNHGGAISTLAGGWTYYPAPTTIYASAGFEDGTFGGVNISTPPQNGDSVGIVTTVAHTGTHSVRQFAVSSGINDVAIGGGRVQDDIVGGTGRYHRYYFMVPPATLARTATVGQIKMFLSRVGGTVNHFVVLGIGAEFRDPDPSQDGINVFAANMDQFNIHINDKAAHLGVEPVVTPDVWHEVQVYEYRDPLLHIGYAKVWYDGKLIGNAADPLLGDDNPANNRGWQFGLVYTQDASGYPIIMYLDDVAIANGYIDPPSSTP